MSEKSDLEHEGEAIGDNVDKEVYLSALRWRIAAIGLVVAGSVYALSQIPNPRYVDTAASSSVTSEVSNPLNYAQLGLSEDEVRSRALRLAFENSVRIGDILRESGLTLDDKIFAGGINHDIYLQFSYEPDTLFVGYMVARGNVEDRVVIGRFGDEDFNNNGIIDDDDDILKMAVRDMNQGHQFHARTGMLVATNLFGKEILPTPEFHRAMDTIILDVTDAYSRLTDPDTEWRTSVVDSPRFR